MRRARTKRSSRCRSTRWPHFTRTCAATAIYHRRCATQIAHFFQHYKDLEKGKWVTIVRWLDVRGAEKLVLEAISRAHGAQTRGKIRQSGASRNCRPEGRRSRARRKR